MNVRQLAARVEQGAAVPQRGLPARLPVSGTNGTAFAEELRRIHDASAPGQIKVSAHAQQRIQQREIAMGETEQRSIAEAMRQLDAKGARDALLLRADAAFIVNVPNQTIVTAIGQEEMNERVFTGIDSAMLV